MYNQCFILLFRIVLFDLVSLTDFDSLGSCVFRFKSMYQLSLLI